VVKEGDESGQGASPFRAAFRADETPALRGYRVEEILGSGGHSTVYLATVGPERQAGLEPGTHVAIKHWRDAASEPTIRARLEREVEVLRGLQHPHLVRFLGLTEDASGAPAIVMEAVSGPNLAEVIAAEGPLAPERAQAIGAALCLALEHLATQGLVHRDVKPANVILRRADDQPVLVDFSVTKRLSPEGSGADLTSTGAALGTSAYMAPEQCAGDLGSIDARTDLYGVGALLFQALTGLPPWTHESGWERTQRNPWRQPYPAQPELRTRVEATQALVPAGLGAVVARCLEGDPRARFPDATALRGALLDPSAPPRGAPMAALALALGLCCVVTYGFFNQASRASPNHGQTPQEEPMKTASLAAIATLTPLLAFAGDPAPITSLTPHQARVELQRLEDSSGRALRWLYTQRRNEGAWLKRDQPQLGLTCKILAAQTRWGQGHRFGPYQAALTKTQGYLRRKQWEDGSIGVVAGDPESYLDHAWATLALCESAVFSSDHFLRKRAERALRYALQGAPQGADTLALTLVALAIRTSQRSANALTLPARAWDTLRSKLTPGSTPAFADLIHRLAGDASRSADSLRRQIRAQPTPELFVLVHSVSGASGLTLAESDAWGASLAADLRAKQREDGSWGGDASETAESVYALALWAQRIRSLDLSQNATPSIGAALSAALASGDEAAFAAILRPKKTGAREKAIRRFHVLRGRLVEAGIPPKELTFQAAIVQSNGGDPAAQPEGTASNLRVQLGYGARRLWLLLDDCKLEEGRWWLTDKAATRWTESPQPTKEGGTPISVEASLGLQNDLLIRDDASVSLSSSDGTHPEPDPAEDATWASQKPFSAPGVTASSSTVFVYHKEQARSCGQFVERYASAAAADHAFAQLVWRAGTARTRKGKQDWTLSYVARARNVVAYVLEQDEGRALPTRSAWLERWIRERLSRSSSPAELVEFRPRESDSVGAILLRAFVRGEGEEFAKILRPKKLSYAARAQETFRDLRQRLVATGFDLSELRLVSVVDRTGVKIADSKLVESDLEARFELRGKPFTITLDDCVRAGNRWWLTDRLKPGKK